MWHILTVSLVSLVINSKKEKKTRIDVEAQNPMLLSGYASDVNLILYMCKYSSVFIL